jgi:hypothetical protein
MMNFCFQPLLKQGAEQLAICLSSLEGISTVLSQFVERHVKVTQLRV